mgnify:CR=1 FL=1
MEIRIFGLADDSIVDGPGVRYTVFVQGCPHHCPGCHNPASHDFAGGTLMDTDGIIRKIGEKRVLEERIDFGLISPYKAQVQYLRGKLKGCLFFRPFRSQITIHTVDGFQGQERDVIFISLVRANEDGQIGFLNDLRRMNVAITRARMKLVILGDAVTMSKHAFYKKLIGYIRHISQGL